MNKRAPITVHVFAQQGTEKCLKRQVGLSQPPRDNLFSSIVGSSREAAELESTVQIVHLSIMVPALRASHAAIETGQNKIGIPSSTQHRVEAVDSSECGECGSRHAGLHKRQHGNDIYIRDTSKVVDTTQTKAISG